MYYLCTSQNAHIVHQHFLYIFYINLYTKLICSQYIQICLKMNVQQVTQCVHTNQMYNYFRK